MFSEDLGAVGNAKMKKKKQVNESYRKKKEKQRNLSVKSSSEDFNRKKYRKKKHQKKSQGSKKLSKKIKESFRPETRKTAAQSDPSVLEANWPTLDVLVIFQLFLAFVCLLYAIISAAVGNGSDSWAFFFFALMLLVCSGPSFVLIAKAAVESAIVVYSVLQLFATFFGFICVTAYFIKASQKENNNGEDYLENNLFLLLLINIQLLLTFMINWKPYKSVNLKKVRAAFADLKDGGKAAEEGQLQQEEDSGITSSVAAAATSTMTTNSDYRFYN